MEFESRLATRDDLLFLTMLMRAAVDQNQNEFLDADQVRASHAIMGIDLQLVDDGTYFVATVVDHPGQFVGCGGWGRRGTLYGASHSPGRDDTVLDPAKDAARIRAMYTSPLFQAQGVARYILGVCEEAAAKEGFTRFELVSTLVGERLYTSAGYEAYERFNDESSGTPIPLIKMRKSL